MKIKIKELRQKTEQELAMMLKQNREKLRELKFDLASKKLKNTGEIRLIKIQIAQILTIFSKQA